MLNATLINHSCWRCRSTSILQTSLRPRKWIFNQQKMGCRKQADKRFEKMVSRCLCVGVCSLLTLWQRRFLRPRGAALAASAAVAVDRQAGPQLPLHPLRHGRGRLLPGLLRRRGRRRSGAGAGLTRGGAHAAVGPADAVAVTQRGRPFVAKDVLVLAGVSLGRLRGHRLSLGLSWRRGGEKTFHLSPCFGKRRSSSCCIQGQEKDSVSLEYFIFLHIFPTELQQLRLLIQDNLINGIKKQNRRLLVYSCFFMQIWRTKH